MAVIDGVNHSQTNTGGGVGVQRVLKTKKNDCELQLMTMVQNVLASGKLSMAVERRMYSLLDAQTLNESEMAAIDQLLAALHRGEIRSVPDQDWQSC